MPCWAWFLTRFNSQSVALFACRDGEVPWKWNRRMTGSSIAHVMSSGLLRMEMKMKMQRGATSMELKMLKRIQISKSCHVFRLAALLVPIFPMWCVSWSELEEFTSNTVQLLLIQWYSASTESPNKNVSQSCLQKSWHDTSQLRQIKGKFPQWLAATLGQLWRPPPPPPPQELLPTLTRLRSLGSVRHGKTFSLQMASIFEIYEWTSDPWGNLGKVLCW